MKLINLRIILLSLLLINTMINTMKMNNKAKSRCEDFENDDTKDCFGNPLKETTITERIDDIFGGTISNSGTTNIIDQGTINIIDPGKGGLTPSPCNQLKKQNPLLPRK